MARDGQASRAFALLALGRQREAIEAWERVAESFTTQTPVVREWIGDVRDFLSLSEASPAAVLKNLEGTFDPEDVFFVGTQAAKLGMPEATAILGRAVDSGYTAWDALARHPWIAPVREQPVHLSSATAEPTSIPGEVGSLDRTASCVTGRQRRS